MMSAQDPHYLLKMTEAKGMIIMTECFLKASLARTESRCGHFRADYQTGYYLPNLLYDSK